MKLAIVRVEYSSGTVLVDRASLNEKTGEILLPPRLDELMEVMGKRERSQTFTLEYRSYVLPVAISASGGCSVEVPKVPTAIGRRMLHAILLPSKDQQQQNGRFLHTLSAASFVGAVGYAHSLPSWTVSTLADAVSLAGLGVLLWAIGFYLMKGD
jgi:hypothetical protein